MNLFKYLKVADKRKGTAPMMVPLRNVEKPLEVRSNLKSTGCPTVRPAGGGKGSPAAPTLHL